MISLLFAPSSRGVKWVLMILALAFPMSIIAQSEQQPKRVTWRGIETFENAYSYSGRISAHLGNVNEYNHKITISFSYIEETDAEGIRKFTSRKLLWSAEGKAVAKGFTSIVCKGGGELELVGLSERIINEKLKIPCTTDDKGILAGSFTKPPSEIKPPKIVEWRALRDTCSYSEEKFTPNGERYTYSVWASPGCPCDHRRPTKTSGPPQDFDPPYLYASTLDGRIYSEPSTTSTVLGSPPSGTRMRYTNTTHVNGQAWYYIQPPGRPAGWMSGSQLSCTRPVAPPRRGISQPPLDSGLNKDRPNAAQAAGGRG